MESSFGGKQGAGSYDARIALDTVEHAHDDVADRLRAPWWYHVGLGFAVAIMLVSLTTATVGVVIGGILLPAALMYLAKRVTGVSIDRYRIPPGATRANVSYMALFILAIGGALAAEVGGGIDWAMPLAGAVMILPTILLSYHLDRAYRRELQVAR